MIDRAGKRSRRSWRARDGQAARVSSERGGESGTRVVVMGPGIGGVGGREKGRTPHCCRRWVDRLEILVGAVGWQKGHTF